MTAVEVLEFLSDKTDVFLFKIFAEEDVNGILEAYSPQEIVDRIEKYEAKKNEPVSNTDEFKIGDWVRVKSSGNIYQVKEVHNGWVDVSVNGRYIDVMAENNEWIEHTGPPKKEKPKCFNRGTKDVCRYMCPYSDECDIPPKEEKQKIGHIDYIDTNYIDDDLVLLGGRINQLVDAVNELRGM